MVRRGRRYLIERTAEGTFARWIPVGSAKKSAKKTGVKGRKASGVKTSHKKTLSRGKTASSRSRY